jgi:hypothetical protein
MAARRNQRVSFGTGRKIAAPGPDDEHEEFFTAP